MIEQTNNTTTSIDSVPIHLLEVHRFRKIENKDVSEAIQKVAAAYDCKIVEGVLSHQLKQFVIDGNKVVLSVPNPENKPKFLDERQTTIYKRAVDKSYHLKVKASRFIFSEINQKFPIMPFTARSLEEKQARLGLVECVNHELLQPYPVLHEKSDKPCDFAVHIKFTVLLKPNGSDRITSHALQELQTTKKVDDDPEIKAWLAMATKTKKKGKKGDKVDDAAAETEP
ncbi:hypothetical protein GIB67_036717 [Kingdonia uniflora]|uniref:Uncharacterized protein n=1 Tax=Kingdonia uniflora TaxID=39325 RepID=A0A7J7LWR9_9MAGN|nr:hypothetical protein GIB67_036717 [Kingdonia uniflora]